MALTDPKTKEPTKPVSCLAFTPGLVKIAEAHGYALAIHGSMVRDYDFIAVAWTHAAAAPEVLMQAFLDHTGGYIINDLDANPYDFTRRSPEPKPHGRLAWCIHFDDGRFIDMSIMPPEEDSVRKKMDRTAASVQAHEAAQKAAGLTGPA